MKKKSGRVYSPVLLVGGVFLLFIMISTLSGSPLGMQMGYNLWAFLLSMVKILPGAFILIGLFEVWVPKHVVEKHLGEAAGLQGHMWVILLAGTTVGGLYVAFPVAYTLQMKGARLPVIFTYLGAAGICRLPMTLFEISFMGPRFTLIRYAVSLPLIILSSHLLGTSLRKRGFKIRTP